MTRRRLDPASWIPVVSLTEREIIVTENSDAAKWHGIQCADNREPSTRTAPLHDRQTQRCWYGEPYQHTWPGKDTGAPHPR